MRNEESRVPALRLEGFEGEWTPVTLGGHAKYAKGSGHSKSDLTSPETPGAYPIVLYGRLYTKYQTEIRELDTFAVPHDGAVLSLGGEVLVPSSGETEEDIARASVLRQRGAVIGGDLNIVFPAPTINSTFLALTLSSGRVSQNLASKAQGKSVVHLKKQDLWSLEIPRPSVREQRAIAGIITTVETLADTTVERVETLTNLKQTMLVKMFPQGTATAPEVRFEGFEGEWERSTLGQVVESFRYGVNAAAIAYDGETKYLRITDIDPEAGKFGTGKMTSPGIDRRTADEFLLSDGDIVFARTGATVGRSYLYREHLGRTVWAGFLIRAKLTGAADPDFVHSSTLTPSYWEYVRMTSQRSGQPGLNSNEYANLPTALPSLPEQQAIGAYFRSLDALIDTEKKKLDTLRNLKSALLTQMFV